MKLNLRPPGDYRGQGRVYRVHSMSDPVGWHFVVAFYDEDGNIVKVECSCKGFQNQHNCWHEQKVIEWEGARIVLGSEEDNGPQESGDSDSTDRPPDRSYH